MAINIGGEKWFQELSNFKFPSYYCFYLAIKNNENGIAVKAVESKAKDSSNIKYGSLDATLSMAFNYDKIAIIDVLEIKSSEHYYQTIKKLTQQWNVAVIDERETVS